jgi:cysteine desulfurase
VSLPRSTVGWGGGDLVYLDHNATSPMPREVIEAVIEASSEIGNPSSVHKAGRRARARLEGARQAVIEAVGGEEAVLTSGATEANNLALKGIAGPKLVAATDHPSVLEAAPDAGRVPVDPQGLLDLAALERCLAEHRPALVSIGLANSETGIVQPIGEIARRVHAAGALLHVDAVQALGRIPSSMAGFGVDLCSVSAHKLGGPKGAGALVLRGRTALTPLLRGGGQEGYRRGGTENLAGAVGFAKAIGQPVDWPRIALLRDELEAGVLEACSEVVIAGIGAARLPNTSCLITPGLSNEVQLMALDLDGICVSSGSACSSGKVATSHVLRAMGMPDDLARCAIRVSLGWSSGVADVARFLEAYRNLMKRRRVVRAA